MTAYWGPSDGGTNKVGWGRTNSFGVLPTGLFSNNMTALSPNTIYYYRCYATNSAGSAWASGTSNFTTLAAAPVVDNDGGAATVTTNSAWLRGTLTSTGGVPTTVTIYWGPTDGGTTNANWGNTNTLGILPTGLFSNQVTGLILYTWYYYRCFATNSVGGMWAAGTSNFMTLAAVPVVDNAGGAVSVTTNSAWLRGTVTSTGGAPTTVTIYWGLTDGGTTNANWGNTNILGILPTGLFSNQVSGLGYNTKCYYRCYATNPAGGAWASGTSNFTTLAAPPVVDNAGGAVGITTNSAWLQGTVTSTGGLPTTVTIYWGAADGGTNNASWGKTNTLGVLPIGLFSNQVTGLSLYTKYYYRCFATNSMGATWASGTTNFMTPAAVPAVDNDGGAGGVTATNAWLRGTLNSTGGAPTAVTIYWGAADGGTIKTAWGNTIAVGVLPTGLFSNRVTGLSPNATYYYCCYATNVAGETWASGTSNFTTQATPPAVDNDGGAAGVTTNSAWLSGTLTSTGGAPTSATIYWGSSDSGTNNAAWGNSIPLGSLSTGLFSNQVSGLSPNVKYYYRCYATNSAGQTWATATTNFTTPAGVPALDNDGGAAGVATNSAWLSGTLLSTGGVPTTVTIYWGPSDGGTIKANWSNFVSLGVLPVGSFSNHLSVLSPNATYCYCCYATNAAGDAWASGTSNFTTIASLPAVDNDGGAAGVTTNSAWLRGTLTSTGGLATSVTIYWGSSDAGTNGAAWGNTNAFGVLPTGLFSNQVSGLSPNVKYYYRCYAVNSDGEMWAAATTNFATPIQPPAVDDASGALGITGTNAWLVGTLTTTGGAPTTVKVYWGISDGGTTKASWGNTNTLGALPVGLFSNLVSGLSPNVTYYYRSYATNGGGEVWAAGTTSFATPATAPVLDNGGGAQGITATNAWLRGTLISTGGVPTSVTIYWGSSDGGTNKASWGNSILLGVLPEGLFSNRVSGLNQNVTYYYCCYATNSIGETWALGTSNFTTQATPPAVDNDGGATGVTTNSAWLNGTLLSTGGAPTTVTIYWGIADGGTNTASWGKTNTLGVLPIGLFSNQVTGLSLYTRYYYRCCATNSTGKTWASGTTNFTTLAAAPAVDNDGGAGGVTATNAWLRGTLNSTGGAPTAVTIYWGAADGGTIKTAWGNTIAVGVLPTGLFSNRVTGLSPNATYYYCCYATNVAGETWASGTSNFTTQATPPAVDNDGGAAGVTTNSAWLSGTLTSTGGAPTSATIYWGSSDSGTNNAAWGNSIPLGSLSTGLFSNQVSGLSPNVKYYYRCYATNSAGQTWATATTNFTTPAGVPALDNDGGAAGVATNSAWLSGTLLSTGGVPTTVTIYWGPSDGGTIKANWSNFVSLGVLPVGSFSNHLSVLSPNGTYYYCCYATNAAGDAWASGTSNFTTIASTPAVDNDGGAAGVTTNSAWLRGTLTSTGGLATAVTIYWGTTDGGTSKASWSNTISLGELAAGPFSNQVSSLAPNVLYRYRCAASNSAGETWAAGTSNFTTLATPPVLDNDGGAGGITATNAWLRGTLDSTGGLPTVVTIYWGTSDGGTNKTGWGSSLALGSLSTGSFSNQVTGLSPNVKYYYRGYATNSAGQTWVSATTNFMTPATTPVLNNNGASNVTATSAWLRGTLISTGGVPTSVTIYWGLLDGGTNKAVWGNSIGLGNMAAGVFSNRLSGLSPNAVYYYRCYATNSAGEAWALGSDSFTTSASTPALDNDGGAGSVSATDASLRGTLTSTGGVPTSVTICWGLSDGGTDTAAWDNSIPLGNLATGPFSSHVGGLSPNVTYYYCCHATNSAGEKWALGSMSFSTPSIAPAIDNDGGATGVTSDSAWLMGALTSTGGLPTSVAVFWGAADGGAGMAAWENTNCFDVLPAGSFSNEVTGLNPNFTYYYRCYATNSAGEAWASDSTNFITLAAAPTVDNDGVGDVTPTYAWLQEP